MTVPGQLIFNWMSDAEIATLLNPLRFNTDYSTHYHDYNPVVMALRFDSRLPDQKRLIAQLKMLPYLVYR